MPRPKKRIDSDDSEAEVDGLSDIDSDLSEYHDSDIDSDLDSDDSEEELEDSEGDSTPKVSNELIIIPLPDVKVRKNITFEPLLNLTETAIAPTAKSLPFVQPSVAPVPTVFSAPAAPVIKEPVLEIVPSVPSVPQEQEISKPTDLLVLPSLKSFVSIVDIGEEFSGTIDENLKPYLNETDVHFSTRSNIARTIVNPPYDLDVRSALIVSQLWTNKALDNAVFSPNVEKYLTSIAQRA